MNVLFVCTGNTCRSPMAQGLAKECLSEEFRIGSAGIIVREGDVVSQHAVEVLREKGIDISGHRPQSVTKERLDWADIIFTMTRSQAAHLLSFYPEGLDKVKVLGDWTGADQEVSDPWGGTAEDYRECARQLEQMLRAAAAKLKEQAF